MVAMGKKAWFALLNWKTRMGSPRSPARTRLLPLPGYRAPGAVAGSHAADGSAPRARRWSGRPVGGLHRDQPDEPSSRSPGRSVRTRATAPPVFAQIGPEQPSAAGIPAHRVGDSSALMAPPSQLERCPPNRVNSSPDLGSWLRLCPATRRPDGGPEPVFDGDRGSQSGTTRADQLHAGGNYRDLRAAFCATNNSQTARRAGTHGFAQRALRFKRPP